MKIPSSRAVRVIFGRGDGDISGLSKICEACVRDFPGVGDRTIAELRSLMSQRGLDYLPYIDCRRCRRSADTPKSSLVADTA